MMPYYYYDYMAGDWGALTLILWLVIFIDLVLLGVWLWKQISK